MMKSAKKIFACVSLFIILCLMAGFGSKSVKLFDEGRLIDLDKAIQNAALGKKGSETSTKEKTEEIQQENLDEKNITEKAEATEGMKGIYQVTVRGETILFEDQECKNTEELKNRITPLRSVESVISLLDDYAEAHTYREVLDVIKEAGINYTEEK